MDTTVCVPECRAQPMPRTRVGALQPARLARAHENEVHPHEDLKASSAVDVYDSFDKETLGTFPLYSNSHSSPVPFLLCDGFLHLCNSGGGSFETILNR